MSYPIDHPSYRPQMADNLVGQPDYDRARASIGTDSPICPCGSEADTMQDGLPICAGCQDGTHETSGPGRCGYCAAS